jgi:hypothetical protein
MKNYNGKHHIEQDSGWDAEKCPATKTWWKTKMTTLKTWTMYKQVDGKWTGNNYRAGYQTPVGHYKNEKEARKALATN